MNTSEILQKHIEGLTPATIDNVEVGEVVYRPVIVVSTTETKYDLIDESYPIVIGDMGDDHDSYTSDGKFVTSNEYPTIYKQPFSTQFKPNVLQWAADRDLLHYENYAGQFLKVIEEVNEIKEAIELIVTADTSADLEAGKHEAADAIGDTAVTLVILANQLGLDFDKCCEQAWNEIKDRKGKTINGTFVKNQ